MNDMRLVEILSLMKEQQDRQEMLECLSLLCGIVVGFFVVIVIIWAIEKWRLL